MASSKKLFAILAVDSPEAMGSAIDKEFPDSHLEIAEGQWLIVAKNTMTTVEMSERLKITDDSDESPKDSPGAAMVISFSNYFGRASQYTWEWISTKMGQDNVVA